jgi:hypothetical protein
MTTDPIDRQNAYYNFNFCRHFVSPILFSPTEEDARGFIICG